MPRKDKKTTLIKTKQIQAWIILYIVTHLPLIPPAVHQPVAITSLTAPTTRA